MFTKIFLLGLLTLFACQQGTHAVSQTNSELEKLSVTDIINRIKELLSDVEEIAGGIIGDGIGNLEVLFNKLLEFKDKYLQGGIDSISDALNNVVEYIKEATAHAAEVGVDISECLKEHNNEIENIRKQLFNNLQTCVTHVVDESSEIVRNDIKEVKEIVSDLVKSSVKFGKCFATFKPFECFSKLFEDLSEAVATIPKKVASIISSSTTLVNNTPAQFATCVSDVAVEATSASSDLIKNIANCVDNKLSSHVAVKRSNDRLGLSDLIGQVKDIITALNELVSGVIGDAVQTLNNALNTVGSTVSQVADQGLSSVTDVLNNVSDYVKNVTEHAVELGVDITSCVSTVVPELENIGDELGKQVNECTTNVGGGVITFINNELGHVNQIVKDVTKIPLQLTKCLLTLRPLKCVEELLKNTSELLVSLPENIGNIVAEVSTLVADLPGQLEGCVGNIVASAVESSDKLISEVGECADKLIENVEPQGRASVSEIIGNIRKLLSELRKLVSGVIQNAVQTIRKLLHQVEDVSLEFGNEGLSAIDDTVSHVTDYIASVTAQASELNVNIDSCLEGREEQILDLGESLSGTLSKCTGSTTNGVINVLTNELGIVREVVKNVTNIPLKLSKCLLTFRPILCLTNLLNDTTAMVADLPSQVNQMVEEALSIVNVNLPSKLQECVNAASEAVSKTADTIISEIEKCTNVLLDDQNGYEVTEVTEKDDVTTEKVIVAEDSENDVTTNAVEENDVTVDGAQKSRKDTKCYYRCH